VALAESKFLYWTRLTGWIGSIVFSVSACPLSRAQARRAGTKPRNNYPAFNGKKAQSADGIVADPENPADPV